MNKNILQVNLSGFINEHASLPKLCFTENCEVHINFDKVTLINSSGIKIWISWIEDVLQNAHVVVEKVPQVIAEQANFVFGFFPDGIQVKSFLIPYFFEESGSLKSVLLIEDKDFVQGQIDVDGWVKLPVLRDDSGNLGEVDVIEQTFFKFIKAKVVYE